MFQVRLKGKIDKLSGVLAELGLTDTEVAVSIVVNSNEELFRVFALAVSRGVAVEVQPVEQMATAVEKSAAKPPASGPVREQEVKPKPKPKVEKPPEVKTEEKGEERRKEEAPPKPQPQPQQPPAQVKPQPQEAPKPPPATRQAQEVKEAAPAKVQGLDYMLAIGEVDFQKLVSEKEKAFSRKVVEDEE